MERRSELCQLIVRFQISPEILGVMPVAPAVLKFCGKNHVELSGGSASVYSPYGRGRNQMGLCSCVRCDLPESSWCTPLSDSYSIYFSECNSVGVDGERVLAYVAFSWCRWRSLEHVKAQVDGCWQRCLPSLACDCHLRP